MPFTTLTYQIFLRISRDYPPLPHARNPQTPDRGLLDPDDYLREL